MSHDKPRKRRPKISRHISSPEQHTRICSWLYMVDCSRDDAETLARAMLSMPEPGDFKAMLADLHDLYRDYLDTPHTFDVKQALQGATALVYFHVSRRRAAYLVTADPAVSLTASGIERRMKDDNAAYLTERLAALKTADGLRFEQAIREEAARYLYRFGTEKELLKHLGLTRREVAVAAGNQANSHLPRSDQASSYQNGDT